MSHARKTLCVPSATTDSHIYDRVYRDHGGTNRRFRNISADCYHFDQWTDVAERHLLGGAGTGPFKPEQVVLDVDAPLKLIADRTHALGIDDVFTGDAEPER